jgi:23S rRNA pseudouridine1911/1915/1917 synthase
MQLAETHIALPQENPIRLQEYAVGIFNSTPTKSGIKKAIKKGLILVNSQPASTALFITGGEKIELFKDEKSQHFKRLEFPLEVLFEDDYLAVVYKPAGVLVSGNKFVTITNALPQNLEKSKQPDSVRPQPVHRLDYPTSGLLLIGKTSSAITLLSRLFENKEIQKTYHAICVGKMKQKGTIDLAIENKEALTTYRLLKTVKSKRFDSLNLVELSPKTGRKHQLRIHLSSIGNQILGDKEHGNPELILKGKGLYLHASRLEFIHPLTKLPISITKELPKKFKKIFL